MGASGMAEQIAEVGKAVGEEKQKILDELWASYDKDNNGSLDESEISQLRADFCKSMPIAFEAFKKTEEYKSKKEPEKEDEQIRMDRINAAMESWDDKGFFGACDRDADGKVSKEEFARMLENVKM